LLKLLDASDFQKAASREEFSLSVGRLPINRSRFSQIGFNYKQVMLLTSHSEKFHRSSRNVLIPEPFL